MRARYHTVPFEHQRHEVETYGDYPARGLFWEMGCGKTKPIVDEAVALYEAGEVEGLLVVAPNGVHRNWITDELPIHLPPDVLERACLLNWTSSYATKKFGRAMDALIRHTDGLPVLAMSYSGIMTQKGARLTRRFLDRFRCLYTLDESPAIKTPSAKRTRRVLASARYAPFRRILTGTPISNSPFDIYTQLKFLDDRIWRTIDCGTFAAFKTTFGVWKEMRTKDGRVWPELLSYRNLDMLHGIVDAVGSRLLKEDTLDLPPKLYTKRYFKLDPRTRRVYDDVRADYLAFLDSGELVTAPLAITRLIRLQQITSGYVPSDEDGAEAVTMLSAEGANRRINLLLETLEEHRGRHTLVWAKYTKDILMIEAALRKAGFSVVTYYGATSEDDRDAAKRRFQAGEVEVFLANPAAAGMGLTLHRATVEVFYNSSYRMDDRKQAEDRAHRIGQKDSVLIVDLCAEDTVDEKIIEAMRRKQHLSDIVLGDRFREWI